MLGLVLLQVLNGLQFGVLLFLVAAGLTLVFGVMGLVNLAHGALYMLGAYLAAAFAAWTGSFGLALLLAVPAAFAIGLVLERLVVRHLYARSHLDQVLATFGLILVIDETVRIVWGSVPLGVAMPELLSGSLPLFGAFRYPVFRLAIIAAGLLAGLLLAVLIGRTRAGMLLRAGATHAPIVSALGVDVGRLFALVFGLGAALAGFAGAMVAPILSVDPGMGDAVLIPAFIVVVIGGIGSVRGALAAALLVGIVDTLGRSFGPLLLRSVLAPAAAAQTGRTLAPMLVYLLMAAILAIRPAGLFPARGAAA